MAVNLLVEGQFKTPSSVAGKYDLQDFNVEIPYPNVIDKDDMVARQEAMFYIKNFFLFDILKAKYKGKLKSIRSQSITLVEPLTEEDIKKAVDSGALKAIDTDSLTAADINKFKNDDIYWTLVLLDGDNTPYVSSKLSQFLAGTMQEKHTALKTLLGIEEVKEAEVIKGTKDKGALFKAAGKEISKKRSRPARKKSSSVEVLD